MEASYKVIAIDVGHVCQNLYIACEAIEAGKEAVNRHKNFLPEFKINYKIIS